MVKIDKRTLYIGGLDEQVNEAILKAAFIPFGDIIDVQIPLDHATDKNRGFGFVEFELVEDAAAAMDNMNMCELYGRILKVNYARPIKSYFKPAWSKDDYFDGNERPDGEAPPEAADEGTGEIKDEEADAMAAESEAKQ